MRAAHGRSSSARAVGCGSRCSPIAGSTSDSPSSPAPVCAGCHPRASPGPGTTRATSTTTPGCASASAGCSTPPASSRWARRRRCRRSSSGSPSGWRRATAPTTGSRSRPRSVSTRRALGRRPPRPLGRGHGAPGDRLRRAPHAGAPLRDRAGASTSRSATGSPTRAGSDPAPAPLPLQPRLPVPASRRAGHRQP